MSWPYVLKEIEGGDYTEVSVPPWNFTVLQVDKVICSYAATIDSGSKYALSSEIGCEFVPATPYV